MLPAIASLALAPTLAHTSRDPSLLTAFASSRPPFCSVERSCEACTATSRTRTSTLGGDEGRVSHPCVGSPPPPIHPLRPLTPCATRSRRLAHVRCAVWEGRHRAPRSLPRETLARRPVPLRLSRALTAHSHQSLISTVSPRTRDPPWPASPCCTPILVLTAGAGSWHLAPASAIAGQVRGVMAVTIITGVPGGSFFSLRHFLQQKTKKQKKNITGGSRR